jgi:hypothetical protein
MGNWFTKKPSQQLPQPPVAPEPWAVWMRSHIGEVERTGSPPSDFDKMIFSHTTFGDLNGQMESGCAATICAALELTGYKSPHSAAALSFVKYGTPCSIMPGAICVFNFGGGDHHVSICESVDGGFGIFLGGNQSHYLQRATYPLSAVIAVRWPVK